LLPIRRYHGTFTLTGRIVRLPTARACAPLLIRLDRPVPYPPPTIRAVTLLFIDGRLHLEVTAELPVASCPAGQDPDTGRVAGVDLGSSTWSTNWRRSGPPRRGWRPARSRHLLDLPRLPTTPPGCRYGTA
jgi:hypothetical protein